MPLNVHLLEEGFDLIAADGVEVVERFYAILMRMDPKFPRRFRLHTVKPVDMAKQRQKLVGVLLLVRKSLRNLNGIAPTLRELGQYHSEKNIQAHEYMAVGFALIEAMGQVGGHGWLERYGLAWRDAYVLMVDVMLGSTMADAKLQAESDRWMVESTISMREKLRADLMEVYGGHTESCQTRKWWARLGGRTECTCGWPQARATFFGPA